MEDGTVVSAVNKGEKAHTGVLLFNRWSYDEVQMGSEMEKAEERLKSFTGQLQTECGILERLVYKHKNQHRRCSYFQHILKVRRDFKLLKLAKLEEILEAAFVVIGGSRPKQKVQLLESLKRRRSTRGKYNFLERLLGVARLLSQMVEPLLKAAMEISTLLARSFFMKFSLTVLAVLARIRVLIQQMLLDVVLLYNTVCSLSQKEQTVKLNQDGFEVFREYYPRKEEATTVLECIWQVDKYVVAERTDKNESQNKDERGDFSSAQRILYENIDVLLGVDESETTAAEHPLADLFNGEQNRSYSGLNEDAKIVLEATEIGTSTADVCANSSGGMVSETSSKKMVEEEMCIVETPDLKSISMPASLSTDSSASPVKKETKKRVAFVAVKSPAPSAANEPRFHLKGTEKNGDDEEDPFFKLLTGGNKKSRLL